LIVIDKINRALVLLVTWRISNNLEALVLGVSKETTMCAEWMTFVLLVARFQILRALNNTCQLRIQGSLHITYLPLLFFLNHQRESTLNGGKWIHGENLAMNLTVTFIEA